MNRYVKTILIIMLCLFIAALATAGGYFVYKNQKYIRQEVTLKADSYTELYFQDNESLPAKPKTITNFITVPYTFSFTIHNVENKTLQYPYEVTISGFENKTIDKKTLTIANNESKTIHETFYLPNSVPVRTQVTVALTNKNQQIFFWMGGATK